MTGIDMFDTAYNSQFPPGAAAYAGYVDGQLGSQPNYAFIVAQFPSAQHLSIALFAEHDADALDVEGGAASPGDIPGWYARQRARGIDRPCIYASTSTMEAAVIPVIRSVPFLRSAVRLWTAHYGQGEHICGPGSCGQLSFDADGTQWTSGANGLILDQSLLLPDFFGTPVPPAPASTQEVNVQLPVLGQGSNGQAVRNWQALLVARGYGYMIAPSLTVPFTTVEAAAGVDGSYGAKTSAATAAFQAAQGITASGVDGKTWAAALG